jgi:hypothetical protein
MSTAPRNLLAEIEALKRRITEREKRHEGVNDLRGRLVHAVAKQLRRECRAERQRRHPSTPVTEARAA